jgi:hypothetical protein
MRLRGGLGEGMLRSREELGERALNGTSRIVICLVCWRGLWCVC